MLITTTTQHHLSVLIGELGFRLCYGLCCFRQQQGYAAAERLLDRYKVDMIVGSACCASAARASVLAEQRGVPLISTACSADSLSDKV